MMKRLLIILIYQRYLDKSVIYYEEIIQYILDSNIKDKTYFLFQRL